MIFTKPSKKQYSTKASAELLPNPTKFNSTNCYSTAVTNRVLYWYKIYYDKIILQKLKLDMTNIYFHTEQLHV